MRLAQIADDGIDVTIVHTARASPIRWAVWAPTLVLVALAYSPLFAMPWLAGVLLLELSIIRSARPFIKGLEPTPGRRWAALAVLVAAAGFGSAGNVLFWNMGGGTMRLAATGLIFMMLISAQIFMSRSTAALLARSLPPSGGDDGRRDRCR